MLLLFTGIQRSMDKRSSVKCCRAANWPRNIWASGMEFAYKNSSERGNNRTMASRYLIIVNLHRNVKLCSLPTFHLQERVLIQIFHGAKL